jgi:glucosamine-phosphate N-acetyltransferase
MEHLIDCAREEKCYKVILNCSDDNKKFYKKCLMDHKGNQMCYYFE